MLETGPRLQSLGLHLRPVEPSDLERIRRVGDHADSRWFGVPHPCPESAARRVIAETSKGWNGAFGLAAIVLPPTSAEIVVFVGVHRHASDTVEIAYGVAPTQRGRGIATATAADVSHKVLAKGWAEHVEAVVMPTNAASIPVRGLGFRLTGFRDQQPYDGSVVTDRVDVLDRDDDPDAAATPPPPAPTSQHDPGSRTVQAPNRQPRT